MMNSSLAHESGRLPHQRHLAVSDASAAQLLALAMRMVPMGVVRVDLRADTIELDTVALAQHGLLDAAGCWPLRRWLEQVAPSDQAALMAALARREAAHVAYAMTDEQGVQRRVELQLDTEASGNQRIGLCRDVTMVDRANRALNDEAQAEQRRRDQGEFLARVSHELRTPMNAILGFAQLLHEDGTAPLASHQKRWLDQVRHGGRHLLALVEDVLDMGRLTSGRHGLTLGNVSLDATLRDCHEFLMPLADSARVQLELAPTRRPTRVMADSRALRQVLVNVLGNAIKFNRAGGSVTTRVKAQERHCVIEVWDDGPGIAADRIARVFLPFERLGAEASGVPGSGLGLSIAKELVEAMGGSIEALSIIDSGTCICITLPLVRSTELAQ